MIVLVPLLKIHPLKQCHSYRYLFTRLLMLKMTPVSQDDFLISVNAFTYLFKEELFICRKNLKGLVQLPDDDREVVPCHYWRCQRRVQ